MTASAGGGGVMSSKDLAHRLELVSEEASTVRAMLFDAIRGQHAALSKDGGSFDCSGEAERRFGALKQKVGMAAAGTDSQGGLTPLISSAATHGADLQRQAQSCQMMVDALGKVVRIGELLEAVDSALAACKFRTSAKSMVEAEAELLEVGSAAAADASADGGGAGQCDGTVVRALRQMTRKRRTSLEGALRDCATAAIVIEPGHISVIKSLEGFFCGRNFRTSVPLSDILESLQELDLLDDFLSTLADRIRRCLCDPVVAGGNFPPAAVVRDEAKSSLRCSPPASSPPPSGGTGLGTSESSLQLPAQLARLTTILSFIHEEVMQKKLAPTACLGNALLCPSGDSGLLGVCLASLRQSVPSSVHGLAAFEQLSAPCADFENRLFEMGFIGEKERGQLQGFVARADEQFASARRTAILAAARATLLGDYHNSVPAGGGTELQMHAGEWGPTQAALQAAGTGSNKKKGGSGVRLFVFEPCQVTSVAKEIIDMAHAALLEACGGGGGEDTTKTVTVPPIAAKELFRTARDIFELFRAVVPVHHRDQIERVPRTAALFYNDCAYLSFHLMTMGHQYRQRLPPPVNQVATMVDMVPLLRELGESHLRKQVSIQKHQLREFYCSADLLSTDREDGGGDAEAAMRRSVYHLRQLAQAWSHVLPVEVYDKCIGELLDGPASAQLNATLLAEEIGEEQSHRLRQAFSALQEAEAVFSGGAAAAIAACPSWPKFKACGDVLEFSMEQMGEQLRAGGFRAFSSTELAGLVTALFQPSSSRNSLLAAIHTAV